MRHLLVALALTLMPRPVLAQPSAGAASDADALQAEVERDYAQALASDCPTACRALDSMRRATDRLCALDPGDRCTTARRKLDDATARVRTSCPECAQPLGGAPADSARGMESGSTNAPSGGAPQPSAAPAAETAEQVQSKRGGCAGCAVAPREDGARVALGAASALLVGAWRRRRRGRR